MAAIIDGSATRTRKWGFNASERLVSGEWLRLRLTRTRTGGYRMLAFAARLRCFGVSQVPGPHEGRPVCLRSHRHLQNMRPPRGGGLRDSNVLSSGMICLLQCWTYCTRAGAPPRKVRRALFLKPHARSAQAAIHDSVCGVASSNSRYCSQEEMKSFTPESWEACSTANQ